MRDEARAWAIGQIERFLPAGDDPLVPFAEGEAVPVLFRFPSPRGLLPVLDGRPFVLTPAGVEAAFAGDLATAFDYPWVREFGAVALLDPLALSFVKVRARPGWFVCDGAQIAQDAIFVPNRSTAERLEVGMRKEDVPADPGAVAEARALCEEYVRELPLLDARCRELAAVAKSHPDGVRERLAKHGITLDHIDPERGQPMFALTRAQRRALLDEVR